MVAYSFPTHVETMSSLMLPSAAPPGHDTITQVSPEDIRISVDAAAPSLVVVRNSFDNLWNATVDGRPVHMLAADYFLQAVPVPKGHHEVRLRYRDPDVSEGLMASGLVWLALGLAAFGTAVFGRRRRRMPTQDAESGDGGAARYSPSGAAAGTGGGGAAGA